MFAPTGSTLAWSSSGSVEKPSAIAVGIASSPHGERWLAGRPLPAHYRAVAAYGLWRSLQAAVQPSVLALTRVTVIGMVSAAARELEGCPNTQRPAMLVVLGLGRFLFARHAIAKAQPVHPRRGRRTEKRSP